MNEARARRKKLQINKRNNFKYFDPKINPYRLGSSVYMEFCNLYLVEFLNPEAGTL